MADYYAILKKAIGALPDSTGEARRTVYEKARQALVAQLKSFDPPLTATEITQQRLQLEDCIRRVEAEAAKGILTQTLNRASAPPPGQQPSDGLSGLRNLRETEARRLPPSPMQRPAEAPRAYEQQRAPETRQTDMRTPMARPLESRHDNRQPEPRLRDMRQPEGRQPDGRQPDTRMQDYRGQEPRTEMRPTEMRTRPVMEPPRTGSNTGSGPGAGTGPTQGLDRLRARPLDGAPEPTQAYTRPVPPPVAPTQSYGMPAYEDTYGAAQRATSDADPYYQNTRGPEVGFDQQGNGYQQTPEPVAERVPTGFPSFEGATTGQGQPQEPIVGEPAFGPRKTSKAPVVAALVVTVAIVGLGVAAWVKRDDVVAYLGMTQTFLGSSRPAADRPISKSTDRLPGDDANGPRAEPGVRAVPTTPIAPSGGPVATAQPAPQAPPAPVPPLPPVAAPTPPVASGPSTTTGGSATPGIAAAPAALPTQPVPLVAQRVTLQEEGTGGSSQVQISQGKVVWQMVKESPAAGKPPVAILRARVDIPDRKLSAVISIQPNVDPSFSASHLVELKFTTAPDFDGKAIGNVPGVIMKAAEQQRGDRLEGASAKIASGFFWLALSANEADKTKNLALLKDRGWIDIPIVYDTGRRAVLTLEKAGAGDRVLADVMAAWAAQGG